MQAEVQSKARTIENNRTLVNTAQRTRNTLNPEGLKLSDLLAQNDQKQARLEELSKQHPELQQVFCQDAVF